LAEGCSERVGPVVGFFDGGGVGLPEGLCELVGKPDGDGDGLSVSVGAPVGTG
jgi:hypothetical protein